MGRRAFWVLLAVSTVVASTAWATPQASGHQLWVARYNGPSQSNDSAYAVAVSPDGSKTLVTGTNAGINTGYDYCTLAYDAPSGTRLWARRYNGYAIYLDAATGIAMSPDGSKAFVTGYSFGRDSGQDYVTLAYDVSTGAGIWLARYDGPSRGDDVATAIAASPDGTRVFVTGYSWNQSNGFDYATAAYDATTGAQTWVDRFDGNGEDEATAIGVSPDGSRVFVTGESADALGTPDYYTAAYDVTAGSLAWATRFSASPDGGSWPTAMAVSPDGSSVFVTGNSDGGLSDTDYATAAFDAGNGAVLWSSRYNGPANGADYARAIAPSPDGSKLFVTGDSWGMASDDFLTVAYDPITGDRFWTVRYNGPANDLDWASSIAVDPSGAKVFVAGGSWGAGGGALATVAYDPGTGAIFWARRYHRSTDSDDVARAIAVSPDGSKVFVTGNAVDRATYASGYLSIAYST